MYQTTSSFCSLCKFTLLQREKVDQPFPTIWQALVPPSHTTNKQFLRKQGPLQILYTTFRMSVPKKRFKYEISWDDIRVLMHISFHVISKVTGRDVASHELWIFFGMIPSRCGASNVMLFLVQKIWDKIMISWCALWKFVFKAKALDRDSRWTFVTSQRGGSYAWRFWWDGRTEMGPWKWDPTRYNFVILVGLEIVCTELVSGINESKCLMLWKYQIDMPLQYLPYTSPIDADKLDIYPKSLVSYQGLIYSDLRWFEAIFLSELVFKWYHYIHYIIWSHFSQPLHGSPLVTNHPCSSHLSRVCCSRKQVWEPGAYAAGSLDCLPKSAGMMGVRPTYQYN